MRVGEVDLATRVLVVAEIGNNHEGSAALAQDMIGLAADAGAGAVKLQMFRTERYVSRRDQRRFEQLKRFELSDAEFEGLAACARSANLEFLCTPFDLESLRFLEPHVAAFKIASGDNTFLPLLEAAARTDKPVLLSTGLMSSADLRGPVELIRREQHRADGLALLHCVSSYPTPPAQANLGAIEHLRRSYGCTIGYSDHTMGVTAATLAVACGARIIEKHFTIDHDYSEFRDHQLSADPRELRRLVNDVAEAEVLLGTGEKIVQPGERDVHAALRRSIAAREDLAPGTIIEWKHLTWVRPAGGLDPGEESRLLGRRLVAGVGAGEAILPGHFTEGQAP